MASNVNKFGRTTAILATNVANAGTVAVSYPTGTSQTSFNAGLAGPETYLLVNGNDRWSLAAGKIGVAYGPSNITITNSSGVTWPAGAEIDVQFDLADGNDVEVLSFPIDLVAITGNIDVVTDFRPGVDGVIESVSFVVAAPVTTAARLATLTCAIDGVVTTGGAVALTSANATPLGKVIEGSAVTAANKLTSGSRLGVKATGVTAFSEGRGSLQVRVRKTPSDRY